LVVRDLDSRNGTTVNGQYIKEAHLLPGDRLRVGLTSFKVWYKRRQSGSPASPAATRVMVIHRGKRRI
jgi:pSer/pThr/pTyr-binding forkhead associated (FHA) protein